MTLPYFQVLCCLFLLPISITANAQAGNLEGQITDKSTEPVPGATVQLKNTSKGAVTDTNGYFTIKSVAEGSYNVLIRAVGFETVETTVNVQKGATNLDIELAESIGELGEVVVSAKSESSAISQKALQIASIDVRLLQNETADVAAILDRTTGVRVRQSGGLGSRTRIQLNGLTGQAVRMYYNGIPLNFLGGIIQINNLPVNTIERIDVYKGVMPIDVGTDALAGGINIVTQESITDMVDVSYKIGSFNTHVATLNANKRFGDHIIASLSGFFNYSDNNYKMEALQRTDDFKEIEVNVERFHNAHRSRMLNGSIGLINTSFADKLIYSVGYTDRYDQVQHGVRVGNRAVGEAFAERDAFIQTLQYNKKFFQDRLITRYFANYTQSNNYVNDSTTNVYNWFGDIIATNDQGTEVLPNPSARRGKNNAHIHRLSLDYHLADAHVLKASSFYSHQEIVGEDPYAEKINDIDPNTIPSYLNRSITGLSYESNWFDQKLELIVFGKFYYYDQSTANFTQMGGSDVFEYRMDGSETGHGFGIKYLMKENLFVRASYEQAIRIPDRYEVFGNFTTIAPNFSLRPEQSKNINAGGYYKYVFNSHQSVSLDANFFLRDQSDLIRLQAGRNENDLAKYINEEEVDATGMELSLTVNPVRNFELTANYTTQQVVKAGVKATNNTNGIGFPIPNIPTSFFNLSARYNAKSPISEDHQLSIFSYFTYVDEFDLILQGQQRNDENIIPRQQQLDLGLNYSLTEPGLSFSIQCNNLLNAEVFDNYRVPKPGRNYSLKIRYLFQKL